MPIRSNNFGSYMKNVGVWREMIVGDVMQCERRESELLFPSVHDFPTRATFAAFRDSTGLTGKQLSA